MKIRAFLFRTWILAPAFLTALSSAPAWSTETIEFDHLSGTRDAAYEISLRAGESFQVVIKNTLPAEFSYETGGILLTENQASSAGVLSVDDLENYTIKQSHDKKYGGYRIRIRKKQPGVVLEVNTSSGKKNLEEVDLLISVKTLSWDLGFSGGFTVSDLVDPVFASSSITGTDGASMDIVVRDEAAEDEVSLGLASMVHVYHDNAPWAAITFGLGISDQSDTTYFVGPSWRMSDKAVLTLGYMWGNVDRLPSGLFPGDVVSDANVLQSLPQRVEGAAFFSLSYSFVSGIKDLISKPFKGNSGASGDGNQPTATPSEATDSPAAADSNGDSGDPGTQDACTPCSDNDLVDLDCDEDGVKANEDPDDCDASAN